VRGSDVRTEKRAGRSISYRGRGDFLTTKEGIGASRKTLLQGNEHLIKWKGRNSDQSA
jgi:hypothetical protein